ncbi:MAG: hypothetical protein V9G12_02430 [Microthrixaceae bacterium]
MDGSIAGVLAPSSHQNAPVRGIGARVAHLRTLRRRRRRAVPRRGRGGCGTGAVDVLAGGQDPVGDDVVDAERRSEHLVGQEHDLWRLAGPNGAVDDPLDRPTDLVE